ncbi:snaclec 2-like, partial [Actinia tenebrosa]|uniref:Snaclec 2-like n=1 Tax=Actinia tenebrosa TaxID=6105 RepID=A0A6P8IK94_ACTTE
LEDYCDAGKHNCSINANCTAAAGTFKCSYTDGYQGDGVICDRACKLGWHLFGGSCYHVYTETKLWQDSSLACQSNQANLVSITSLQENNFVHSLIRSAVVSAVWIGLARSGSPSTLSWSDGSTLSYNNWYRNEPDSSGDCVYMRTRDSKWLDESCTFTLGFVCKS